MFNLPEDSRFRAHIRGGDEFVGWTSDRYIMAGLFNAMQSLLYVQMSSKTKKRVPLPTPIPIPGSAPKRQSEANPFNSMLDKAKKKRASQNLGE